MRNLLTIFTFCASALCAKATTYYVSATGNDANTGKSINEAWQTTTKINSTNFLPGDIILFQGGASFSGYIDKPNGVGGTSGYPVTFSSYGNGKATIRSGLHEGINVGNDGNVTIKNLVVKGAGYMVSSMRTNGINFYQQSAAVSDLDNIVIDNTEVLGYGGNGILISTASATYGYNHIKITNSLLHDNGMGGFQVTGSWDAQNSQGRYSNTDVYIANCKAYYNHGRSDYKDSWSGSGILVAGTIGGTVEYCEAYENGKNNGSTISGPVGIWMSDSKYITIQYCISHHNKGGATRINGSGFNIGGGCYGSVIQQCDSYENEGAGFALSQWGTNNVLSNDTIRNNTSTNDGRNANYGALSFWGESSDRVKNAEIYGNRVSIDKQGQAVAFIGSSFSNVNIRHNAFCIVAPASLSTTLSSQVSLNNNSFPCLVLSVRTGSFTVKRVS